MNTAYAMEQVVFWAAPERIWWTPVLLLLAGAAWFWAFRYIRIAYTVVHPMHRSVVLPGFSPLRLMLRAVLMTIGLGSLAIALMQPQWGYKEMPVMQEGRDVLIALDVSGSMQAQDIKPSRLAFVKLKVRKLLERLRFERVGLILFSGTAFVQCPLTADYPTFLMFLEQVTTESISSGTTAIGSAVTKAVEVFNRSEKRKNKLLLLITDGEDFASHKRQLARLIKDEGVTVFAWGVGTEQGAPIPLYDARGTMTGYAKNKDGSVATSSLNEPFLQELSQSIGGQYERVTQDDGDITHIATALDAYEREQLEERTISHYHDRYPLFLLLTWFCFLLEWLL